MTFTLKPFTVSVQGYGDHIYFAASRSKALYRAYMQFGNVSDISFKDFLSMARARLCAAPELFGTAIKVDDKDAFYVSHNSQYVQFAYPNNDVIFNTHPYDVMPETMRPASYGGPLKCY